MLLGWRPFRTLWVHFVPFVVPQAMVVPRLGSNVLRLEWGTTTMKIRIGYKHHFCASDEAPCRKTLKRLDQPAFLLSQMVRVLCLVSHGLSAPQRSQLQAVNVAVTPQSPSHLILRHLHAAALPWPYVGALEWTDLYASYVRSNQMHLGGTSVLSAHLTLLQSVYSLGGSSLARAKAGKMQARFLSLQCKLSGIFLSNTLLIGLNMPFRLNTNALEC